MICPDCNGKGEAIYYEYLGTDFAKNIVNIKPKKDICRTCNGSGFEIQTHADRIRAMSDEELADAWMKDVAVCHRCVYTEECECDEYVTIEKCKEGLLKWLKQPV